MWKTRNDDDDDDVDDGGGGGDGGFESLVISKTTWINLKALIH